MRSQDSLLITQSFPSSLEPIIFQLLLLVLFIIQLFFDSISLSLIWFETADVFDFLFQYCDLSLIPPEILRSPIKLFHTLLLHLLFFLCYLVSNDAAKRLAIELLDLILTSFFFCLSLIDNYWCIFFFCGSLSHVIWLRLVYLIWFSFIQVSFRALLHLLILVHCLVNHFNKVVEVRIGRITPLKNAFAPRYLEISILFQIAHFVLLKLNVCIICKEVRFFTPFVVHREAATLPLSLVVAHVGIK